MTSERYSETRTFREENRGNTVDNSRNQFPNDQRVNLPIQQTINRFNQSTNEQRLQERLRHQDTTVQWINDPVTGREKFRVNVNVDGFNRNEISVRINGNKLVVVGEHLETKDQSSAKKTIEKTYDLPRDVDPNNHQVTYPSSTLMQIDFPSQHSNVMIDNGRIPSNLVTNYNSSYGGAPDISREKNTSEFISTRKIGGGGEKHVTFPSSSVRSTSQYDNNGYSSTSNYQTPINRDYSSTNTTSFTTSGNNFQAPSSRNVEISTSFDNNFRSPQTYPSSTVANVGGVQERTYTETRREVEQRRSSPTTGTQTSREFEHHRSGSPSLGRTFDDNRFRTATIPLNTDRFISPAAASSRNIEVREFSRRVGGADGGFSTDTSFNLEPIRLSSSFNTDAFYRSAFQPRDFTNNFGQKCIEMKLDVSKYHPDEIKVSIEGNDLIVKAEHNDNRPPTASSRNYFYKQVTLPPNTDMKSIKSQRQDDGQLYITAKSNN